MAASSVKKDRIAYCCGTDQEDGLLQSELFNTSLDNTGAQGNNSSLKSRQFLFTKGGKKTNHLDGSAERHLRRWFRMEKARHVQHIPRPKSQVRKAEGRPKHEWDLHRLERSEDPRQTIWHL